MFKGRQFDQSVILLCVRWYLAYSLSLRDLEEMMAERGIAVDHTTIHRWTVRFAPLLLERFKHDHMDPSNDMDQASSLEQHPEGR
jgi:transposase-like protein